jgi:hypothetical protein
MSFLKRKKRIGITMEVHRIITVIADVHCEGGRAADKNVRRVATAAVITNPSIDGQSGAALDQFASISYQLGKILTTQAIIQLGGGENVENFGKAAIVGGKVGISSTKKVAGAGTAINVPLSFRDNSGLETPSDCMEVSIPGSPKHDEIVVIAAFTNGGRPHPWQGWS